MFVIFWFYVFMLYVRMFINDFSAVAAPLRRLTQIEIEFIWTTECEEAFHKLKRIVGEEIVLKVIDYGKDTGRIKLAVDSS